MKRTIAAFAAVCCLGAGCVGTYVSKSADGGARAYRLAILYPFEVESVRVVTTNAVYELGHYRSEGANSNTVAFASETIEKVSEGVAKGVVKGMKGF